MMIIIMRLHFSVYLIKSGLLSLMLPKSKIMTTGNDAGTKVVKL